MLPFFKDLLYPQRRGAREKQNAASVETSAKPLPAMVMHRSLNILKTSALLLIFMLNLHTLDGILYWFYLGENAVFGGRKTAFFCSKFFCLLKLKIYAVAFRVL